MLLSDIPVLAPHHAPDVAAIRFGDRAMPTYKDDEMGSRQRKGPTNPS
jgi:hypothetical protein